MSTPALVRNPVVPPHSASVLDRVPRWLIERLLKRAAVGSHQVRGPVVAPYSGEICAEVPLGTADDVRAAVQRAKTAQRDWARRSFKERAEVFSRFHDLVLERQDELLDVIQLEAGKARKHAFEEVADTAIVCRYYAHHGEELLAPQRRRGALPGLTTAWEHHVPLGVVGLISPWNYPLTLAVTDAVPALLAGNAVVLKPDQQTPLTALYAGLLLDEAGLPRDLFQIVTGRGRDLGGALIDSVQYIGFTGSTATGRLIGRQAGERLIGCSLELGGKNPMLVLEDAELDRAAEGAVRGCFANAGQLCISIERIYVHSSVYERFLTRLADRTQALRLGATFDYSTDMGSLVSKDQLEKVSLHVRDALDKGAAAVAGGHPRTDVGPFFYEPTVLVNVSEDMLLAREETFGPVVSVYRFDVLEEAIARANDTPYGLNASIWSSDPALAMDVATRIEAGTVNVNEAYAAAWASVDAPMGGFKDSGLGRRHGAQGILKYTEAQTIAVQHLHPLAAPSGVREDHYSRAITETLKVLKRIPGLR